MEGAIAFGCSSFACFFLVPPCFFRTSLVACLDLFAAFQFLLAALNWILSGGRHQPSIPAESCGAPALGSSLGLPSASLGLRLVLGSESLGFLCFSCNQFSACMLTTDPSKEACVRAGAVTLHEQEKSLQTSQKGIESDPVIPPGVRRRMDTLHKFRTVIYNSDSIYVYFSQDQSCWPVGRRSCVLYGCVTYQLKSL